MKTSNTTRKWLAAVMNHAIGPYQDEAGCREVLADHLATCQANHAKAVEWRKRCDELKMHRGAKQSAAYNVNRNAMLIRWAQRNLETLALIGFDKFKAANSGRT